MMSRWIVFLSLVLPLLGMAATPRELLLMPDRPSVSTTMEIDVHRLESHVGRIPDGDSVDRSVFRLYEKVIAQLLQTLPERRVYLMARDMEDLHDAMQIVLAEHPKGAWLRDRIQMLPVSRELARNSTDTQLLAWMKVQGIDAEKLIAGQDKVLWLDTGYSGKIYRRMLSALLSQIPASDPERGTKMTALLSSVDPRLLAAWEPSDLPRIKELIRAGHYTETSSVVSVISGSDFYFEEFFESPTAFSEAGLPRDRRSRGQWLITNVERRRPNWRGRGLRLSADGTTITVFEAEHMKDSRVDRERLIRYQVQMHRHFTSTTITEELSPLVREAADKHSSTAPTLPLWGDATLVVGARFRLSSGTRLETVEVVKDGSRTRVLKVRSLDDGKVFSFKHATAGSADGRESIERDMERIVDLRRHNFKHAALVESGEGFLLRDWIEGARADDWLKTWEAGNSLRTDPGAVALEALLGWAITEGIYVRNLRPSNLVWDGKEWVIVNSGSTITGLSPSEARERYREGVITRWSRHAGANCAEVLTRMGHEAR